jgi:CRP-like cAMP-binding protein
MFNKKTSENDMLTKTMKECPLFSELSGSEIKSLLAIAHVRDYSVDEKVFDEGTIGLCFYIIVKGSVKIISDSAGNAHVLKEFKEGGYFSEVHLFTETNHSVSCITAEVTRLIAFARPDFEEFIRIKAKTANKVLMKFLDFFGERLDALYRENMELKHKLKT